MFLNTNYIRLLGLLLYLKFHAGWDIIVKAVHPGMISITVTPHVIRHAKATHMLSAGVNLFYIRDMLGHSSVITTEIYARSNPEFLEKAILKATLGTMPAVQKVSRSDGMLEFLKKLRC